MCLYGSLISLLLLPAIYIGQHLELLGLSLLIFKDNLLPRHFRAWRRGPRSEMERAWLCNQEVPCSDGAEPTVRWDTNKVWCNSRAPTAPSSHCCAIVIIPQLLLGLSQQSVNIFAQFQAFHLSYHCSFKWSCLLILWLHMTGKAAVM